MEVEKSCESCFWSSLEGFCVEGGRAPERCKGPCEKYTPIKHVVLKGKVENE